MLKNLIKKVIPKIFLDLYHARDKNIFTGEYASWNEAEKLCSGYDQDNILRKVAKATEKVIAGEAVFERDSMLFYKEEYNWPLVNALLKAAAENKNELCVLDFGGALGSTYFQNRKQFTRLNKVRWCVVEQDNFAELGAEKFQTKELCFYKDIAACIRENKINVILFSSVLQYLNNPWEILKEAIAVEAEYIIVDRTLISKDAGKERLCIQKVPAVLYQASYPMWVFADSSLENYLTEKYEKILEFDSLAGEVYFNAPSGKAIDKGFIFKRKNVLSDSRSNL